MAGSSRASTGGSPRCFPSGWRTGSARIIWSASSICSSDSWTCPSGVRAHYGGADGAAGYHPAVLLKLFVYGYLNQVPSSRRLEREAGRNVELMWLTGRLAPDHKTIADFRRDNGPAIRRTCAQFVELCRRIGVLRGDCVAIDGSKFKAVNNRDRNFTKGKIASRIAHLEASVARYIDEMVRIDRQEAARPRPKVAHLRRTGRIRQEIAPAEGHGHALEDAPDGQISLTDPDARAMATNGKGSGLVGYNAQVAVDTETHLIVAHDVTNAATIATSWPDGERGQGRRSAETIARPRRQGLFQRREVLACHETGIIATVPRPETSGNRSKGMFVKADFAYDPEPTSIAARPGRR